MPKILTLHGPNLNLLGTREPQVYGAATLAEIDARLGELAAADGYSMDCRQSNAEHELVGWVQQAGAADPAAAANRADFIIVNPAAFTHTSIALRDALAATAIPFIEVHLSNVHAREAFRRRSFFSDLAAGVIAGFGAFGYELAYYAAAQQLRGE